MGSLVLVLPFTHTFLGGGMSGYLLMPLVLSRNSIGALAECLERSCEILGDSHHGALATPDNHGYRLGDST